MPGTVNLAEKYSSKLDQLFTAGSYTDRYVNKKYDFTGAKTVEVYTVTTVAPTNYDRTNTGDRFGGNNELQDVLTTYKRYKHSNCFYYKYPTENVNYHFIIHCFLPKPIYR